MRQWRVQTIAYKLAMLDNKETRQKVEHRQ